MQFEFATPQKILFGRNSLSEVAGLAAALGSRILLLTGQSSDRFPQLVTDLKQQGMDIRLFPIKREPTLSTVHEAVALGRAMQCEIVLAIGGGSVIDAGKAVAVLLTNRGDLLDYLEIIGRGQSLTHGPLPYIAIPTTAGTGTEATANAVIKSPEHGRKVSLRGRFLLPAVAVVDPMLSRSMSAALTASTGMDALTQLIEAFISRKANPLTDALCREGLIRVSRSLLRVWDDGDDIDAREDMSLAALFSGMALANAGLGAVHGFAAVIGGMTDIPHGIVCGRLLYPALCVNLKILWRTGSAPISLKKLHELGRILTGSSGALAEDALAWIQKLSKKFKLPSLSESGLRSEDLPKVADMARQSSSMRGNPVDLLDGDLIRILEGEKRQNTESSS
ncbi:MAG: iron-containing alcohol dehydrogenase [Syntrophaceae bacterium]|nr:iron-containing alcohol dehydrogenase [Syntrophaceae bacterium]